MSFGNFYSEVYDSIHHDKDYDLEAEQIVSFFKQKCPAGARVLDFGCGTGKHARLLHESGIDVSGYDPNVNMIRVAKSKNVGIPFYDKVDEIPGTFEFVYSLFDVLSYQTSDSALNDFLREANELAKPEGWVLLDGWHLPGLINDPPESRTKLFTHDGVNYVRDVRVTGIDASGVATLEISIKRQDSKTIEHVETHKLRGFEVKEIFEFIESLGGNEIQTHNVYNYASPLKNLDWRFAVSYHL